MSGADNRGAYLNRVLIGGRERVAIEIVAYDPSWPARYAAEYVRIRSALGTKARRIEHVGSTSVPGLAAKPIIDIILVVDDASDEDGYGPALEAAGYVLRVREPDHHHMYRTPARDVHIHIWATAAELGRHLVFRDRLRSDPGDRLLYEQTKRELAKRDWADMNDYAAAKSAIIAEITARATS